MGHHPRLSDEDLRQIALFMEQHPSWGCDSIDTVETHYRADSGRGFECVYPDCATRSSDPIEMWKHVHFGRKHGQSFGIPWDNLGWDLVAANSHSEES